MHTTFVKRRQLWDELKVKWKRKTQTTGLAIRRGWIAFWRRLSFVESPVFCSNTCTWLTSLDLVNLARLWKPFVLTLMALYNDTCKFSRIHVQNTYRFFLESVEESVLDKMASKLTRSNHAIKHPGLPWSSGEIAESLHRLRRMQKVLRTFARCWEKHSPWKFFKSLTFLFLTLLLKLEDVC